jgi:NAD(P)-dependent dehydrogenase (short-subunit alcohol dehydrogenase family)
MTHDQGGPAGGRGTVVITGCSTGIGRATTLHLESLGFDVFAGVRREADGERIRGDGNGRVTPLIIDVTDEQSIRDAAATVRDAVGDHGLAGLVNNAGVAVSGPLEFLPLKELRHQLEVNLVGQVAVTQALLPLLRRAHGRIVNVGSVGGTVALPFVGPYAISKFGMEAFSDSLRREVGPLGVSVSLIKPGPIATSIWETGNRAADAIIEQLPPEALDVYGDRLDGARAAADTRAKRAVPAGEVAKEIAHALTAEKPKTRYVVTRDAKAMIALSRLLPDRVFDRLVARVMG